MRQLMKTVGVSVTVSLDDQNTILWPNILEAAVSLFPLHQKLRHQGILPYLHINEVCILKGHRDKVTPLALWFCTVVLLGQSQEEISYEGDPGHHE